MIKDTVVFLITKKLIFPGKNGKLLKTVLQKNKYTTDIIIVNEQLRLGVIKVPSNCLDKNSNEYPILLKGTYKASPLKDGLHIRTCQKTLDIKNRLFSFSGSLDSDNTTILKQNIIMNKCFFGKNHKSKFSFSLVLLNSDCGENENILTIADWNFKNTFLLKSPGYLKLIDTK